MPAGATPKHRVVAWVKAEPAGAEVAEVDLAPDRLAAVGTAIGSDPEPYRLDYELETRPGFVTEFVRISATGADWTRTLHLRHDGAGNWTCTAGQTGELALPEPGGQPGALAGALDPDLGLSPLFNSLPVLRRGLLDPSSRPADFLMAWISVPDLRLHASRQRYSLVRAAGVAAAVVRFESLDEGAPFRADVLFDADGLVVDYPQLATRI
jgi:hypothetical protein